MKRDVNIHAAIAPGTAVCRHAWRRRRVLSRWRCSIYTTHVNNL